MPTAHPRPYHRGSLFGDGPRIPMCRERRAVWKARLNLHRRAKRITPLFEDIGNAMLRRLGSDGRLDPSHATVADDVGCSVRSVQRALERFKACGLLMWVNRIVRSGLCVDQCSNAYALALGDPAAFPSGGQSDRQSRQNKIQPVQRPLVPVSEDARQRARDALARVAAQRSAAIFGNRRP